ncbi:GNAT family N-acetyltransferase [Paraglaciecola sp. L1A13]|uniref:GNAT family N-acetyltransferase n=1 Tax=Paraglaciecola sp. L1A13 TaxID=2686359 RepID=UPI00351A2E42
MDTHFQGQGLGSAIMIKIETYLHQMAKKGATIGLLAATGKEAFYGRYGYIPRPSETLGNGMCKFI